MRYIPAGRLCKDPQRPLCVMCSNVTYWGYSVVWRWIWNSFYEWDRIFDIFHWRLGQECIFLYIVLSRKFELIIDFFFKCTVFIFSFSQIWQPDIQYSDKNNQYYARIKIDISSSVFCNVIIGTPHLRQEKNYLYCIWGIFFSCQIMMGSAYECNKALQYSTSIRVGIFSYNYMCFIDIVCQVEFKITSSSSSSSSSSFYVYCIIVVASSSRRYPIMDT